jgi:hypothetical protein
MFSWNWIRVVLAIGFNQRGITLGQDSPLHTVCKFQDVDDQGVYFVLQGGWQFLCCESERQRHYCT